MRVLWLLNHTTLRRFEVAQLKNAGVSGIFCPKSFPYDEGNLSASVTYEFDKLLGLDDEEVFILNSQDWYETPSLEAWEIVNRHFDIAFIGFFPKQIASVCKWFSGGIILRAFGLGGEETYSKLILKLEGGKLQEAIKKCGKRFYFGMGYSHLAECEDDFVSDRSVFMPVGLSSVEILDGWDGAGGNILFVCPRIGSSGYFKNVYDDFCAVFKGLPYKVGGAQPIDVNDPSVLGFIDDFEYKSLMKNSRVMFYHSREKNHIHYHPFEAVRAGMPLVFMSGGMLDCLGGRELPGRCQTLAEARDKIERILSGDTCLVGKIRSSQAILLEAMDPELCQKAWRAGFSYIQENISSWLAVLAQRPNRARKKRIGVILPVAYRGGSLRGSQVLARALYIGSRQCGEDAEIVFLHLADKESYPPGTFADWPDGIRRREFSWLKLNAAEARRAMRYAGFSSWEPTEPAYLVPDDGIRQLQDCDLWLVVSDRLECPLLPLKPVVHMIYDYLQRYVEFTSEVFDLQVLKAARAAARVLVTSEFTYQDALQYAGLPASKVAKVPMLPPVFPVERNCSEPIAAQGGYFIWTTNAALHKNHLNAVQALRIYYEELDGQLDCHVTGVDTMNLLRERQPHLQVVAHVFKKSAKLSQHVHFRGDLSEVEYRDTLRHATFLWHAGKVDNGTFSVIEAASLGVPSLSSDYPAMREINSQFHLNLAWMDASNPQDMARQLKKMESSATEMRTKLPDEAEMQSNHIEVHAAAYWREVATCL